MSLLNFFCTWNVDKKVPRDSGGRGGGEFKGFRVTVRKKPLRMTGAKKSDAKKRGQLQKRKEGKA